MDYTVQGILQARILEWVAFSFSRGSSQPRDWTQVSHIADRLFTGWATREALLLKSTIFILVQDFIIVLLVSEGDYIFFFIKIKIYTLQNETFATMNGYSNLNYS